MTATGLMESRMHGNAHVRFGERGQEDLPSRGDKASCPRLNVVLVSGTRGHTEALRDEVADVFAPMGLRLAEEKTKVAHIDEGFDFLGFRIQRHRKRGTDKRYVYTYPSKAALAAVKRNIKALTRSGTNLPLTVVLHRLNPVLRGWTTYFRHGVSSATFGYLRAFVWRRVICWLRHKNPRSNWKQLRRRYLSGWWPKEGEVTLFNPSAVPVTRYRYRAARIPSPWADQNEESAA